MTEVRVWVVEGWGREGEGEGGGSGSAPGILWLLWLHQWHRQWSGNRKRTGMIPCLCVCVCVCVCFCSAPAAPSRWPSSASRPHSKKLLNVCSMFPSLFSLSPHLISSFLSLFL